MWKLDGGSPRPSARRMIESRAAAAGLFTLAAGAPLGSVLVASVAGSSRPDPETRSHGSEEHGGTNLPQELMSFVGRVAEIAEVRRLLAPSRLVTITSPGGDGQDPTSSDMGGAATTHAPTRSRRTRP